ncbi:MAG: hypothetical protein A2199_10485 [Hydrogenophilales bacterium RIFOXYA1_FULL_63_33]|nr:MAG: hypothetical protein A2199_10485 [Hydrogenophilales bacterium RIFOXYA1_FULL_63_33]
MVRLVFAWALLACGVAHAAALTARLDKSTVALGEAVTLILRSSETDLDKLDTAPLDGAFDVFSRTRSQDAEGDTLVLTLYPRKAGALSVPALSIEGRRSTALPLTVTDGSATVPRVTAHWTLAPAEPRVNEPARLTLSICDDGSLQWQRPELPTHAGRIVRALGEDEGQGMQAGEPCTLHHYYWALLATQSTAATVAVPMLDASRFGERLRFPGAELSYRALALPAWLPAHVPPVAPQLNADPLPARWPLQRPLAWRIDVAGGYSEDDLQALLDLQLRDSPALGVYPPLIETVPMDAVDSPLSRYRITLYLQPRVDGRVIVPTLRFPWYDAGRGQLASTAIPGKALDVFDPRWRLVRQVAAAGVAALLLIAAGWRLRRMVRWRLARRRGVRAIRAAADARELAHAVRRFSLTGQPEAPSLGAWKGRMQLETGRCVDEKQMAALEAQCYGQASSGEADLRAAWVGAMSRARPASINLKQWSVRP